MHSDKYWTGPKESREQEAGFGGNGGGNDSRTSSLADNQESGTGGRTWGAQEKGPLGDQVLANAVLRMRDSLWHYEFQWAVADGDIGRAMLIMGVSMVPHSS